MDWQALGLSLRLSACTTLLLLALGMPLAWWLASTRWRGRFLVEAVVALPLVLPPTVIGFYVLTGIGAHSPLGRWSESLCGQRLPFSFAGLLLGSVLYSLPFAVQPLSGAFAMVDRRLLEAAWCLGSGSWDAFRRVVLPLAWPGVLAGIVLCFAHAMGEFGVVLMVGGDLPGVTRTLSISIYDEVQALNFAAAHQAALIMLSFSFLVLALTYGVQRRHLQPWARR